MPKLAEGRPRAPDRQALGGILFVLHTGIQWEYLPQELGFGSGMTSWRRLAAWNEARCHGVPVLPVDVNRSCPQHSVEQTEQGFGVRLALSTVKGISEHEVARLAAGQPATACRICGSVPGPLCRSRSA